jgi:hypothetical protein
VLAEGRLLAQLPELSFVGRSIGTRGVEALARSPHAANLPKLEVRSELGALSRSKLTSTGVRVITSVGRAAIPPSRATARWSFPLPAPARFALRSGTPLRKSRTTA